MKKKLSIIFRMNIIDGEGAVFVQPRKRCPAAETKIDPVTMVRIKASINLEQTIHKGEQAGPFTDKIQIIVITDNMNNKKRDMETYFWIMV